MKRICFLLISLCFVPSLFAQTLFTYGNSPVDKAEFMRAYNKNKVAVADKEKSLREYLDLYTRFKLKVRAALDLRLDTMQQLQYDLQNFRSQVDESYMNNEKAVSQLVDEAFERSQKDIHVVHFYIEINAKMNPADTLNAWKAIKELQERLRSGVVDYEDLAANITKKYVPVKQSDIGFITVFSLPYDYEKLLYALKPGETSNPYRSSKGLHVFKVMEERKGAGKWRIAQILLAFPPGENAAYLGALESKADSVYALLQKGQDFSAMVKQVSNDKLTYMSGGEMPEFGTGKFDYIFEKEVFKLSRDGEISRPFASPYGIHIVKRLKQTQIPIEKDANYLYELKQKVLQDARINGAKERFVKEIMSKVIYKRNAKLIDADLYRYADSVAHLDPDNPIRNFPINDKIVLSFEKGTAKGIDWLNFVRTYTNNTELYHGEKNGALFSKFISTSVLDYYKKHLEEYNADFRYQMEEFKEGNMLFEIMEKKIWGNASNDSTGLLKQYNEHKKNYLWASSASVILYNASSLNSANEAIIALKKGKPWKKIVEEANNTLQADSGRYEISQLPLPAGVNAIPGLITDPVVNPADGTASFIKIEKIYAEGLQRNFEEARGLVINDYQNILEEKWIDELKKKYPVKINEVVFQSLLK